MAAQVGKVGVVGLGAMGAGIAQLCVEAGVETVGREVTAELGERAAAIGAALLAANLKASFSSNPVAVTITTTFGLPSVRVPVLSTTSVSTFSMRSKASAFLISTPACAPRPTPTMIDMGVARPSAQGHAMIRTVTAARSP